MTGTGTAATAAARRLAPLVPGSFLLGSAMELRRDMLATYERAFQRYGDVVRFRAGPPGARLELHLLFPSGRARTGCWPAPPRTTARTTSSTPRSAARSATGC